MSIHETIIYQRFPFTHLNILSLIVAMLEIQIDDSLATADRFVPGFAGFITEECGRVEFERHEAPKYEDAHQSVLGGVLNLK